VFLTLIFFFSFAVENTVYKQVRGIEGEMLGTVVNKPQSAEILNIQVAVAYVLRGIKVLLFQGLSLEVMVIGPFPLLVQNYGTTAIRGAESVDIFKSRLKTF
jgi:hypothetical protein